MPNSKITSTVLIVDDTISITGFVQAILHEKGYHTIIAENGTQALVMAQDFRPDLILLDIMMPDIDGYTICQQLKADRKTKDIPVIFLSALNSTFDKIKAFKCGAVDFVSKPVNSEELTARVQTHLTIGALNRELQNSNRNLETLVAERTIELRESNKQLVELNARLEQTVKELRSAKVIAESKNDNKTTFLSKLSHEILNDSNIIEGFAELIKCTGDLAKHAEYADCIKDSAGNLVTVIQQMIEYNNAISGNCRISRDYVSVGAVLDGVYQTYLEKAQRRGLSIVINNSQAEGFDVYADETMLYSILSKLVSNSLKFSEKGTIEIGASLQGGTAVFYVKDQGIGISPDLMEKVFEPFVRGDRFFDLSGKGIGLGLPVVRNYVEMLGGQIWVDSTPDVGTIVYVSLPAQPDSTESDTQASAPYNNMKVLVGEDEDVSFVLLNEVLRPLGISAVRARTGKELFELYRQNPDVQLVISKLRLPMMNGVDAMRLIRKLNPVIATVAQISYFSAEDKRAFAESGCSAFIDRPANAAQVREVLDKCIKQI
ncbi:MAG: response regulator [Bacteroidales bacterium]|nr:response regulator [Bacteroidales bacterium]